MSGSGKAALSFCPDIGMPSGGETLFASPLFIHCTSIVHPHCQVLGATKGSRWSGGHTRQ